MNKFKYLIITILLVSLCGCSKKVNDEIDLSKIRYISELATIKTYYHNVADWEKEAGKTLWNLFEKDKKIWIEYTGTAKIGVDMGKVNIKVENNTIKITMPSAEVLDKNVDSSSLVYIRSGDGINENPITPSEESAIIKEAQDKMVATIEKDNQLLLKAQDRAKELIKNYVSQFVDLNNEYKIEWIELEESK